MFSQKSYKNKKKRKRPPSSHGGKMVRWLESSSSKNNSTEKFLNIRGFKKKRVKMKNTQVREHTPRHEGTPRASSRRYRGHSIVPQTTPPFEGSASAFAGRRHRSPLWHKTSTTGQRGLLQLLFHSPKLGRGRRRFERWSRTVCSPLLKKQHTLQHSALLGCCCSR